MDFDNPTRTSIPAASVVALNEDRQLTDYLLTFGIKHFTSDEYWEWGAKALGPKHGKIVNKLRAPLTEGKATARQFIEFYDYISHPAVAGVVHSMKARAIASSLSAVDEFLPRSGRILDLGCSIGYSTIYYGLRSDDRYVVGCDASNKSIIRAKSEARKRNATNVLFELADIQEKVPAGVFSAVVSTQVLGHILDRKRAFRQVGASLSADGTLISVEALGSVVAAKAYVAEAEEHGLWLHGFRMLGFEDVGKRQVYPQFLFRRFQPGQSVDLSEPYLHAFGWIRG
jgi:SAM-dependent methyltransferase